MNVHKMKIKYEFAYQDLRVLQVAPDQLLVQVHVSGADEKITASVMLIGQEIRHTCTITIVQTRRSTNRDGTDSAYICRWALASIWCSLNVTRENECDHLLQ